MFSFFESKQIKTKLLIAFSILIIIPIGINSIISYYRMVRFTENKSLMYARTITQQINTTFDTYLRGVDNLSIQVAYSDNVRKWLISDYSVVVNPSYEYSKDLSSAFRFLNGMLKTTYGVDGIFIYKNDGKGYYGYSTSFVNPDYNIKNETWYGKVATSHGEKVLIGPYEEKQIDLRRTVISLVRKIKDYKTFKEIGIIVVAMRMNSIYNYLLSNIGKGAGSNIYILNQDGNIIYNNMNENEVNTNFDPIIFAQIRRESSGSFQEKFRSKLSLITFDTSSFTNWKVVNINSKKELFKEISTIRNDSISVGIILIIVSIAFAVIISSGIVKPIHKLMKMIGQIEKGDFNNTIDIAQKDEIGLLTQSFNQMSGRLKDLINQIYIKEEEKRKAEIVALQAQINPHFTYNTLGVIKQMAVIQKAEGISKMVESLITLLQASAKYNDRLIAVAEELKFLESYIYIQETRYCGKFVVHYDCDEAALSCKTLNLILQPIVENAIFHGINNQNHIGKIFIRVRIVENHLQYEVEDDGIGMTQEQLDKIIQEKRSSFERLGVHNVDKRIKLHFGNEYGLSISSRINEGTKVTVIMPLIR